jgi:signal transduction histidine kinase
MSSCGRIPATAATPYGPGVSVMGASIRRWSADAWVVDAVLAFALAAMSQAQLPAGENGWVRLSLLGILVLAVRRRWPFGATLVLAGVLALEGLSADPPANFGLYLAVMLAGFTVAAECNLSAAVLGGLALAAGVVAHDVNSADYGSAAGMASDLAIPVVLWGVGRGVRIQRRRADRAGALLADLEAEQEELSRLAVAAERRHLAREMHDVVTHSVSVIVIQAQAAQRVLAAEQPQVAKALTDIETAGRAALTEMRRLLGVLRDEEVASAVGHAPGLADLPALLHLVGGAGLDVELTQTGTQRPLAPAVELTAYRVVQEALTNALRHAATSTARVTLAWTDSELALDVNDTGSGNGSGNGSGTESAGGGRGLLGLRERVLDHGGTLRSSATQDGGYHVAARLPVRPA